MGEVGDVKFPMGDWGRSECGERPGRFDDIAVEKVAPGSMKIEIIEN